MIHYNQPTIIAVLAIFSGIALWTRDLAPIAIAAFAILKKTPRPASTAFTAGTSGNHDSHINLSIRDHDSAMTSSPAIASAPAFI